MPLSRRLRLSVYRQKLPMSV